MIAGYLTAERDRGRIASDADVDTLAPTLIGLFRCYCRVSVIVLFGPDSSRDSSGVSRPHPVNGGMV
jgi:hypothetical protein